MAESTLFSVKRRKEYHSQKKTLLFSAIEIGRHNYGDLVNLETWSSSTGEPVPDACKMPALNLPKRLPLSLEIERSYIMQRLSFYDVTDKSYKRKRFSFNIPDDCKSETFSVGTICSWALREQFDLASADLFISSGCLRNLATLATIGRWSDNWRYGVLYYKGKIFIDRIDTFKPYWECRFEDIPNNVLYGRQRPIICVPTVRRKERSKCSMSKIPNFEISDMANKFFDNLSLKIHGNKFEDILQNGGTSHFNGINEQLRLAKSNRLLTLGDHKIITATRITGQDPDGPTEHPKNQIEIKTRSPQSRDKFASSTSLSLWIRCALFGVDYVYCGFRNDDGTLLRIEKYSMEDLAEIGKKYWAPNGIFVFLNTFLSWLKSKLNMDTVRKKMGESWLRDELAKEGATFTLCYSGEENVKLEKGDHPAFKKLISERYDQNQLVVKEKIPGDPVRDVPDNWDDSD